MWQRAHQTPNKHLKEKPDASEILAALARSGLTIEQFKQEIDTAAKRQREREKG